MSEKLNKEIGTVNYDNIVIKAGDVGHIELAPGQGRLQRGSVIDAEGVLYVGTTADSSGNVTATGKTPSYILCDDTDTDDTEKTVACVYKNGNYIRNNLVTGAGYRLTDEDAEKLRTVNIIVETAE